MAEATTPPPASAGLIAGTVHVPLEGVSVEALITGLSARVTIAQRYRNREPQPIEAVYVFPLDEASAVCGFEAVSNGVHYVGEVLARDEAFKRYDEAMSEGHSAYLLDEERPDVFTASLGNLPPGAEVLIRLTYVTELALEGDAIRFTLPTTVSPRYAPEEDRRGVGRPDADTLNPPVAWRVPYGLDVTIRIDLGQPIVRIESPSHPVSISLEGTTATVTLATEHAALDRDFVLLAGPSGVDRPAVFIERDDEGRHAAQLAFKPTFSAELAASEVVFLVDRSGSMSGSSIEQVRNALELCLRSLIPGCRFNIVGFGSTFRALFPESRAYDDGSLAEASRAVASLDADLGGTEILPALEFVLERPRVEGLPRQVVVLTDGEVTNTDAVIALAGEHAARARVFTFGIGRGASHHLVGGLARAGRGASEFIYPGERIEAKVMRQFARLLSPVLAGVALDWHGAKVTQAPLAVPPVFAGERLLVYAFLDKAEPAEVTLTGTTSAGPLSFTCRLDPAAALPGRTIATLAARALIRELEEGPGWLEARGSRQQARKADHAKQEIVRLAKTYVLASRETSFVAVEHRDTPIEDTAALRRIPVALTSGWGATDEVEGAVAWASLACAPPAAMLAHYAPESDSDAEPMSKAESDADASMAFGHELFSSAPPPPRARRSSGPAANRPAPSVPATRPLDLLVRLQRADGSWDLTRELADLVGIPFGDLERAMGDAAARGEARVAWATALALAWLERNAGAARAEWQMLAAKAERWLNRAEALRTDGQAWLAAAHEFLDLRC
jgi:hypothetical protein